jgi:hypothetical protein
MLALACFGGRLEASFPADEQGTPVKDRDGPAAVTEQYTSSIHLPLPQSRERLR